MYPTKMEINGKIYKIDTSYKTALACYRAINDQTITPINRGFAIITLLLGDVDLEDLEEAFRKCSIYLRCGKEVNDSKEEADMDYIKDEKRIKTSIRQCYHFDISKEEDLHWYEYNELIEGLTDDTLLSKVREIRNYDISKEKDEEIRRKIIEAKQKVSLNDDADDELTYEEEKNINEFDNAMNWGD